MQIIKETGINERDIWLNNLSKNKKFKRNTLEVCNLDVCG
jgi:hypothetical protein